MSSGENGAHRELTCAMCHRTPYTTTYDSDSGHYEAGINRTYASGEGSGSIAGKEVHAAATIECMDCHAAYCAHNHQGTKEPEYVGNCGVGICHYSGTDEERRGFIAASGFGLTLRPLDNGSKAAHTMFVLGAINESLMEGANEACIACHTRIGVNITWTKNEYMEFTAIDDGTGNWTIPNFTAGGENVTHVNSSNEWTNP